MNCDRILGIDIETSSAADLKKVGAWAYSLHESTIALCVVFSFSTGRDDPHRYYAWTPGNKLPKKVRRYLRGRGSVLAHNHAFEDAIWKHVLEPQGFPKLERSRWEDTQPLGRAANYPASLDGLASTLGCPVQKDQEGKALMLRMCKATPDGEGGYHYPLRTKKNVRRLVDYCALDVGAMIDCFWRLRNLSTTEALVLKADQAINARGVYLDRSFAAKCAKVAEERREELDDEACMLSGFALEDSRAPAALKDWMESHGVELPMAVRAKKQKDGSVKTTKTKTVGKEAVAKMLKGMLPEPVRAILVNRLEANKVSSLSKFKRVPDMVGPDGRLYNALAYGGAHTLRWTSYGMQLHNWAKDKMEADTGALVRLAIYLEDLLFLKWSGMSPLTAISQSARSIIAAPPGRELIAADWSAIEARGIAWLSGHVGLLRLFERGIDVYIHAADDVGSDPSKVGKEAHRNLGKVCVLALGYGMGVLKFWEKLAEAGIHVTLREARRILKAWRTKNAKIVDFWADLENAVRDAITNRGETFRAGRIRTVCSESCLFLRLPSGRSIRYWTPKIVRTTKAIKTVNDEGEVVSFEMTSQEIRFRQPKGGRMVPESTYGGKLAENVTQAVARDLLGEALVRLEATDPYDVVMHVHDSIASEVPTGAGSVDEFSAIMSVVPDWADGLPLKAEGYRDTRFRG